MANLDVNDVKAFVPAMDFDVSKQFYTELGCSLEYDSKELSVLELGGRQFYLQNFYVEEFADNFMLHISVEDVDAWYEHAVSVLENFPLSDRGFPNVLGPPQQEDYGARVCYITDPCGVLIHIAQFDA